MKKYNKGKSRYFLEGEKVYAYVCGNNKYAWREGKIEKVVSKVTYVVNVGGKIKDMHADHLKQRYQKKFNGTSYDRTNTDDDKEDVGIFIPLPLFMKRPETEGNEANENGTGPVKRNDEEEIRNYSENDDEVDGQGPQSPLLLRRSTGKVRPPNRLGYS